MKLRSLQKKDIPYMLEWMQDKDIAKQFQQDMQSKTPQDVLDYIEKSEKDDTLTNFAIVDEKDEYLGTITLKNIDNINKNAEYAIALRKKAIGQGVAHFATTGILEYAFLKLNLNRVYLNVLSDNLRAIKFYEKFGFSFEGEFKAHLCLKGEFKNLKWYAILKENYIKGGKSK